MNWYEQWLEQNQPWNEPGALPTPTPDPRINLISQNNPQTYYPPSGNYPGGLQLINDLGYNPSYPYGGGGSGVPTQRGAGLAGGLLGSILGGLLLPGLGGILGGKLGGMGGRTLTRYLQGLGMNRQPGQASQPAPAGPAGSAGGGGKTGGGKFDLSDFFPGDWGGLGQPMGYFGVRPQNPIGIFGIGGPTMPAGGGSYFGGPAGPFGFSLPGATANLGGMGIGAGMRGAYTGGFRPAALGRAWAQAQGTKFDPATAAFGGTTGGGGPHWNVHNF